MAGNRTHGLVAFVVISALTYLGELALGGYIVYSLYASDQIIWFALVLGFLIVPLIGCQCLSWHLRTDVEENAYGRPQKIFMTASHVCLMGQIWRYVRFGFSHRIAITRNEIWSLFAMRIVHTFCSSLPLLSLQSYLLLYKVKMAEENPFEGAAVTSLATLLLSSCWSLATYVKYSDYCCVMGSLTPWANFGWKMVWRVGEIVSRVLTLALVGVCYSFWIFLVLGLHWLTMLVLLIMEFAVFQSSKGLPKIVRNVLAGSYVYMFCYFNVGPKKSKVGFALYHTIVCLESITLLVLWIIHGSMEYLHIPLALVVVMCYMLSLLCATVYFSCFHRLRAQSKTESTEEKKTEVCLHQCITCRLNGVNKKDAPVPYQADWVQIQENPNPQFFDLLSDQDSCITTPDVSVVQGSGRDQYCRKCKLNKAQVRTVLDNRCATCREKQYTKCKHNYCPQCKGRGCTACVSAKPWLPNHLLPFSKTTDKYCTKCIFDHYKKRKNRSHNLSSSDGDSSVWNVRATSTDGLVLKTPISKKSKRKQAPVDLNSSRTTCQTGELSWDNYDLQVAEGGRQRQTQPRRPVQGYVIDKDGNIIPAMDLGYYSAISSSSNGNSQEPPTQPEVRASAYSDCSGFTSEDYCSSVTSVSSRIPYRGNCHRCGHDIPLESVSMYSGASSTTFNSSVFATAMSEIIDEVNSELHKNSTLAAAKQRRASSKLQMRDSMRRLGRRSRGKHHGHGRRHRRRGGRRRGGTMSDETSTCSTMATGYTGSEADF